MCIIPISLRDSLFLSFIERLCGETENPVGHCDGDSVASKVEDQRWGHLPLAGKIILGVCLDSDRPQLAAERRSPA